jgi:hypothetical protein
MMASSLSVVQKSVKSTDKNGDKFLGWEGALRGARAMLLQANLKRNKLKKAIEIIERKIENDEPWPTATQN